MEVSYYPGCSLHGMASEYDDSIRAVCDSLDIAMEELVDWNCCGASSAHFLDDELAVRLSAREREDFMVPLKHRRHHRLLLQRSQTAPEGGPQGKEREAKA